MSIVSDINHFVWFGKFPDQVPPPNAQARLNAGVELLAYGPETAIEALRDAVALGSNEAMSWLGFALVASGVEEGAAPEITIEGLGWLDTAVAAGSVQAAAWLSDAIAVVPRDTLDDWAAVEPHSQVTKH